MDGFAVFVVCLLVFIGLCLVLAVVGGRRRGHGHRGRSRRPGSYAAGSDGGSGGWDGGWGGDSGGDSGGGGGGGD